jgi:hypothetical protein
MWPQLGPTIAYDVPWGPAELGPAFGLEIGPYDVPWGPAKLGPMFGLELEHMVWLGALQN